MGSLGLREAHAQANGQIPNEKNTRIIIFTNSESNLTENKTWEHECTSINYLLYGCLKPVVVKKVLLL